MIFIVVPEGHKHLKPLPKTNDFHSRARRTQTSQTTFTTLKVF